MSKTILMTTVALIAAIEFGSGAVASPLGATRAAAQAPDMLVEPVAMRGGGVRTASVRAGGVRTASVRAGGVRATGVRRTNVGVSRNVNVTRNRNVDVNRNVNRTVVRTGAWARPGRYWWRPGGAVAAGAALGFVTAATAATWPGAAPGPNMCWYYTDESHRQGFWDACP